MWQMREWCVQWFYLFICLVEMGIDAYCRYILVSMERHCDWCPAQRIMTLRLCVIQSIRFSITFLMSLKSSIWIILKFRTCVKSFFCKIWNKFRWNFDDVSLYNMFNNCMKVLTNEHPIQYWIYATIYFWYFLEKLRNICINIITANTATSKFVIFRKKISRSS